MLASRTKKDAAWWKDNMKSDRAYNIIPDKSGNHMDLTSVNKTMRSSIKFNNIQSSNNIPNNIRSKYKKKVKNVK